KKKWAIFTSRYDTVFAMTRLMQQPCADQFCDTYRSEWPLLPALLAKAQAPKGCIQKISETLRDFFDISNVTEASEDGVLDHMVRMTTSLGSPFIATACRTVCPGSPPCVGKRRYSQLKSLRPERLENYKRLFQNSRVLLVPKSKDRRASLQPQAQSDGSSSSSPGIRRASLLPLHLLRRSSV
uniref:Ankyrin repeat domain 33ba n=1 Tax=Sinocyclocheilus grahami TaxID=75366 RepID=A0A672N488_SINGR